MANRDFIYGRQPVRETLRAARRRITALYIGEAARETAELNEIIALAGDCNAQIQRVKRHRLDQMAGGQGNHQGVALETGRYPYVEWRFALPEAVASTSHNIVALILDRIQDPQNLGAILRSADAFGVSLVVLPKDRAAHVTPAVVRSSAGASENVRIAIVSNLVNCLRDLHESGVHSVGLEACAESIPLPTVVDRARLAVVVGSEGRGLRRLVKENCETLAGIPMRGRVSSFNAGVACAIALYELTQDVKPRMRLAHRTVKQRTTRARWPAHSDARGDVDDL